MNIYDRKHKYTVTSHSTLKTGKGVCLLHVTFGYEGKTAVIVYYILVNSICFDTEM